MSDMTLMPLAVVTRDHSLGMIGLRSAHDLDGLADALGLAVPGQRRIVRGADHAAAWMSPDEILLMMPPGGVPVRLAEIATALAGRHHLAVDLSDARVVFRIEGPQAADVIAKLCPIDLNALEIDEMRRTRAAQVAVALWREREGFRLMCFRSVAVYVADLLANAATPGSGL